MKNIENCLTRQQLLIIEFRKEAELIATAIDHLINQGNFIAAQKHIFDLSNYSKMLGANQLYEATTTLNQNLEKGLIDQNIYQHFQQQLKETIEAINWIKLPGHH